jgi:hypothetical protein
MHDTIRYIPAEGHNTKIALMRGDEELSRTLVIPMTMRIGRAVVRMDGIGGVATPEEHRQRGYSRRVMEAAVGFIASGEAVLTTLYGIPHFYPKYGYATIGPEFVARLRSIDDRNTLPGGITARAGHSGDLPALQRLYRDETALAHGALVRDDDWWTWRELSAALEPDVCEVRVVEEDGRVAGYAWRGSTSWWMKHLARDGGPVLRIAEAFASDTRSADAVLAMSRQWAVMLGHERCELAVPMTCRVGQAAMFQDVEFAVRYHDEAEFMGRATGLVRLLRNLRPELDTRWRRHGSTLPNFEITVLSGGEHATLAGSETGISVTLEDGADTIVTLDPGTVARLVMGGLPQEAMLERSDVPAAARSVLGVLFPEAVPYIYPVDRF